MTSKVLLMKNIKMFWKISFEALNLLQKATLNKNLNEKNHKKIKTICKNALKKFPYGKQE